MTTLQSSLLALALATGAISVANLHAPRATKAAGLEWINGIDNAKSVAKASDKPILLLSMFGNIDEDMPCANARTMRAALFPTPEFQEFAKNEVVLAWEKVRNVPHVTIEIDGKVTKRTVRGNAVLYLCNSDGKVLDVFPGQYAKEDLLPAIRETLKLTGGKSDADVIAYHKELGNSAVARAMSITSSKAFVESPSLSLFEAPYESEMMTMAQPPKPGASEDEVLKYRFELAAAGLQDISLRPRPAKELVAEMLPRGKEMTPAQRGEAMRKQDSANNIKFVRPVIHLYLGTQRKLPTTLEAREVVLEKILKVPYKDPNWGLGEIELSGTPNVGK
ncbi:MAG: hypothetical protein JNK63_11370 [Chthonomonas sp.]|nr:hypothetical protein [Chthonomonas sp.]